jgi:cytochrome P450
MEQQPASAPSTAPRLPRSLEEIPQAFAWFQEMRETRPVVRDASSGFPSWHVFGYEDVNTVLTDHTRFSSRHALLSDTLLSETLVTQDPPYHRKLRRLVNLAFTPKAVGALTARVAEITQELLDAVRPRGEMDVVQDLAIPLPARVISEMLGVEREDWDIIQRWSEIDAARPPGPDGFLSNARDEIHAYFSRLFEERRATPREDLLTALGAAEIDGERLSHEELVNFCLLLLLAGQETTKNLIANFVLVLSDHPDEGAALARRPDLMPAAIEEVLRYLPPVWFVMRRTTTEVELGGVRIPADQLVLPWMVSANRDSKQFPDPATFDIRREPNRHLTFGQGIHFCIGAPLTRLETNVALPLLLDQLPDLRVERGHPIRIRVGVTFMLDTLPVTFTRT